MKVGLFAVLFIALTTVSPQRLRNLEFFYGRPSAPLYHGSKQLHGECEFKDFGTQCDIGMRCGPRNEFDEDRFPEIKSLTYRCYMWDGDCIDDTDCDFLRFCNAKENFCDRPPIEGMDKDFYQKLFPDLFLTPEEAKKRREQANQKKLNPGNLLLSE